MEEKRLLLLIDCQYDFINGSLAVDGALDAMNALAEYLASHGKEYAAIAATLDWHPARHCSFKGISDSGLWPAHCVQHTIGAAIYDPIVRNSPLEITFFTKGNLPDKDEYSIFANDYNGPRLAKLISDEGFTHIDVCGLCGDFCVKESIDGLIKLGLGKITNILLPYTPSIDGGDTLRKFAHDFNIAIKQ